MRRWEFVEGGSDKFWEAAVDGAVVTVRYGRSGTDGREQSKEFPSAEAAQAHFARTVAEKERKGYRETGVGVASSPRPVVATVATAPAAAPELLDDPVDEDAFVLPDAWRRVLIPRRGGVPRPPSAPVKDTVNGYHATLRGMEARLEQVLTSDRSDADLVAAARAHQSGSRNPLGAAVLAAAFAGSTDNRIRTAVDAWVAEFGLPFAARATVELFTVAVEADWNNSRAVNPRVRRAAMRTTSMHRPAADRVRSLLAVCDEETHHAAVEALAGCRTDLSRQVVAAYLVPSESGWAEECAESAARLGAAEWSMLLCSLSSAEPLEKLPQLPGLGWDGWSAEIIATVAEGLGGGAAPLLLHALANDYLYSDKQKQLLNAIAELPSDDGFRGLLAHQENDKAARGALVAAMRRFPRRALRLLAEAAAETAADAAADATAASADPAVQRLARRLLTAHVAAHRATALELLPELTPEQAAVVEPLTDLGDRVPDVRPDSLPELFTSPPWTRPRSTAKPRVLTGLTAPEEPQLRWLPGEREAWAASESWYSRWSDGDWERIAGTMRAATRESGGARFRSNRHEQLALFAYGDEELGRPLISQWRGDEYIWDAMGALRRVAARFEQDALDPILAAALQNPATHAPLLLPYLDVRVAETMADWLARLKSAGDTARSWFARHGLDAARLLVPAAVGKAGAARRNAEHALRLIGAAHGGPAVRAVAGEYGPEAAEVVGALLSADPLVNVLPAKLPPLGDWAEPMMLPQLLVRGGDGAPPGAPPGALPAETVRHVLTMLALSKPGAFYLGLDQVAEVCEPRSLTDFGWAVFEQWRLAGMPSQDGWALHALGRLGDDETVRRLTPILRAWPGEGAHHRAVDGLEVLAAIGSDVALLHLHGIAQRVKFKALKARAQEKIAEVAAGLGLSGEQLSDRLVPDFGLDADGTTVVDYGTRTFTVGFDEQLKPYVLDADGTRRKDLPTPGARDDAELAPAERKRFAALKKDVRTVAGDQIRRLEDAMVTRRSWTAEEFEQLFVGHPLLWHLVRRLVWLAEADGPATAFRVAEDRTLADVHDEVFALPAGATVRLAHPLLLGDDLAAWSELFADYEILQPFRQLGRPVYALSDEEQAGHRLTRFENGPVLPTARLLGMERRGWQRGEPQDAGVERWLSRRVGPDRYVVLAPEHGIAVGMHDVYPEQRVETVWLDSRPGDYWTHNRTFPTFAELDPVTASEVIADLTELTTP
ncbi:WGR and DUF4132 domain-containing protein [Streptomyces sp. FH025]|uniref:WGR and DUF4132 domain-containing protein n=1 Tax=Streptomyces sp. FH025 TaxID=2815937 RepID=UPI001A9F0E5C|nr:DUF4132 domain-containing protein [Streptomyces sp. FH025]MBO1418355.1 DUF4132 domain-containing protein [Streptomyces sp. FH025]